MADMPDIGVLNSTLQQLSSVVATLNSNALKLTDTLSKLSREITSIKSPQFSATNLNNMLGGLGKLQNQFAGLSDLTYKHADGAKRLSEIMEGASGKQERVKQATFDLGQAASSATAKFSMFSSILSTGMNQFSQLVGLVQSRIVGAVQSFNPASAKSFEFAVRDASAAMGSVLTPLLRNYTSVVRSVGDAMASLTPKGQEAVRVFVSVGIALTVAAAGAVAVSMAVSVMTGGLSSILGMLGGLFAASVGAGAAMTGMKSVMESLRPIMNAFLFAMDKIGGVFRSIAPQLEVVNRLIANAFVSLIGPLADLFSQLVLALAPVMQIFAAVMAVSAQITSSIVTLIASAIKPFARVMQAWAPLFAEISQTMTMLFNELGSLFNDIMSALGELGAQLAVLLIRPIIDVVRLAVQAVSGFVRWMVELINQIREFLGLPKQQNQFQPGKSEGMGTRNVSSGSVADMINKQQQLMYAAGSKKDQIPQQQLETMTSINMNISQLRERIVQEIQIGTRDIVKNVVAAMIPSSRVLSSIIHGK